jgi:nucleoside-diphosphate-sugar epimerase
MDKGRPGERYILGGENTSLADFYELLEKVTHKKALRVYLPKKVAMSISQFEEWKARHFSIYPIATREWIENFLHNWAFSSRKAIDELGYAPRSLEEGFCLTCAWLGHPPEESRAQ